MCFFCVFLWSEPATTLHQDWTNTCVLEPCKNDASEREERKSPNPGKRSTKRSVRVYAANCDCVTCLSKDQKYLSDIYPARCALQKSPLVRESEKLEKAGTVDFKKHPARPARELGTRSWQCGPMVPGRFAFPGAPNPRICSISRFGKIFPAIFPEFSSRTPEQTPETATAFSSFLREFLKALETTTAMKRRKIQEPLNAPFLNGLFSSGFSRGKTAP